MSQRRRFFALMSSNNAPLYLLSEPEGALVYQSVGYSTSTELWPAIVAASVGDSENDSYGLWENTNVGAFFNSRAFFQLNSSAITNISSAQITLTFPQSWDAPPNPLNFYLYKFEQGFTDRDNYSKFGVQYSGESTYDALTRSWTANLNATAIADLNANSTCYFVVRGKYDAEIVAPTLSINYQGYADFSISYITVN